MRVTIWQFKKRWLKPISLFIYYIQRVFIMSIRAPLTREDWIESAQRILIKGGIDSVRVDNLAKELNITRGSFYYHFKSREELLQSLLANWRARATENIIQQLGNTLYSASEKLEHLLSLPFRGNAAREAAAFEIGIRGWARRDSMARQAMDEVDRHRLHFLESLLIQMGHTEESAKDVAWLIYAYQLSIAIVHPNENREERYEQHKRIIKKWLPANK